MVERTREIIMIRVVIELGMLTLWSKRSILFRVPVCSSSIRPEVRFLVAQITLVSLIAPCFFISYILALISCHIRYTNNSSWALKDAVRKRKRNHTCNYSPGIWCFVTRRCKTMEVWSPELSGPGSWSSWILESKILRIFGIAGEDFRS